MTPEERYRYHTRQARLWTGAAILFGLSLALQLVGIVLRAMGGHG